jgi:outer membrane protein OmpA-like peptidoglycan-associated protein
LIPDRYVLLSPTNAKSFRESQLQEGQPENLKSGRSARQMNVYYNILNITGDRMRSNPNTVITLTGASDKNPVEGKQMAENVKQYLVVNYSIDPTRIVTVGRDKPEVPSELPGGTKELDLLREGDRRVDITSDSPELLLQIGGKNSAYFKPVEIHSVQQDPLDSHVIFYTAGATETLDSWTVVLTDESGLTQTYGPFTQDQASVSGKTILGTNKQGNYKIAMIGKSKKGVEIRKESYVSLMRMDEVKQEGLRYSILFDFDKYKANENYERFLVDIIEPLIKENGTVIIHGHTDIIGEEKYNLELSRERSKETQRILEKALAATGKKGVRFETYGFGEDAGMSPFENKLPEERFYNRSVIIDIIPEK